MQAGLANARKGSSMRGSGSAPGPVPAAHEAPTLLALSGSGAGVCHKAAVQTLGFLPALGRFLIVFDFLFFKYLF